MTVQQVKDFITGQGWTPQEKPRRKQGKTYLYAARHIENSTKVVWRYIAPMSRVGDLTEDKILAKLNRAK